MVSYRKSLKLLVLLLLTTILLSLSMTMCVGAAGPLTQEYKLDVPTQSGSASGVCAGDVDGDGVVEIISVGYAWDGTTTRGVLGIGTWDGEDATAEAGELFQVDSMSTYAYGVDVGDLDGDDLLEIVTCGMASVDLTTVECQLRVWSWGAGLHLEASEEWAETGWSDCHGVALGELDGEARIATANFFYDEVEIKYCGQVSVWSYGSDLTLEDSEEWYTVGHTNARGVFIGDNKIYTAGSSFDGTLEWGQLRVWSSSLTLEESEEWYTGSHTRAYSVFVVDVDGDGEKDVVTGGEAFDGTRYRAQLRVWSQSSSLTLEDSHEWYDTDDTGIADVFVVDLDGDGVNEILTSGYSNDYKLLQLIAWSYPDNTDPTISGLTPTTGSTANTGKPAIGASFSDDYSGIDVDSVSIKVGGTDVTAQATVTEAGVTYTPSTGLSDGDYTVIIKVSDRSGNEVTATWTFKVKFLLFGMEPMMFYLLIVVVIVVVVIVVVLTAMRGRRPSAPTAPPAPAAPPTAYCPSCGTPVTPGTTFCPKCGRRLQ